MHKAFLPRRLGSASPGVLQRHPPADTPRPGCARTPRTGRPHPPESPGKDWGGAATLGLDTRRRTGSGRTVRS